MLSQTGQVDSDLLCGSPSTGSPQTRAVLPVSRGAVCFHQVCDVSRTLLPRQSRKR